jgi:hypothetical protein
MIVPRHAKVKMNKNTVHIHKSVLVFGAARKFVIPIIAIIKRYS